MCGTRSLSAVRYSMLSGFIMITAKGGCHEPLQYYTGWEAFHYSIWGTRVLQHPFTCLFIYVVPPQQEHSTPGLHTTYTIFCSLSYLYAFAAGGAFWKVAPYITDQPIASKGGETC